MGGSKGREDWIRYVRGRGRETHYWETDEGDEGVSDQNRAADVEVVAQEGGGDHQESGEDVLETVSCGKERGLEG